MRRFSINSSDISGEHAVIKGTDAKHIKNVLRLKPDDVVCLLDGSGNEYQARITDMEAGGIHFEILSKLEAKSESPTHIAVAQAFLKDKKMDTLVRQLTELGMSRWVPYMAERSVPRPDSKKLQARGERWGKIARESLKQCLRSTSPVIEPTVSFDKMLEIADDFPLKIMFWENESTCLETLAARMGKSAEKVLILLGPEGGFTEEEVQKAIDKGFTTISLGPRILKAETAAVAGFTLAQYFFGDMGKDIA